MTLRLAAVAAFAGLVVAAPAAAESLHETHAQISVSPSKGIAPVYRPLARQPLTEASQHVLPAGKIKVHANRQVEKQAPAEALARAN
jgi:hypothetical protein